MDGRHKVHKKFCYIGKKKLKFKIRFSLWSAYALANLKLYKGRLSYLQVLIKIDPS